MNKTEFIKLLQEKNSLSQDKCVLINNILENHFLIGRKNQDKIVEDFKNELNIGTKEANEIYTISMNLLKDSLKEKLKHPFG